MEQQHCCCVERRLGCIVIGFCVIWETIVCFPVHTEWDTICNGVLGVSAGIVLLVGMYKSNKEWILIYLAIEIVHIFALFISSISVFSESSNVRAVGDHPTHGELVYLGWLYLVFCALNSYFWYRVYQLYKIFNEYSTVSSLFDVNSTEGSTCTQ